MKNAMTIDADAALAMMDLISDHNGSGELVCYTDLVYGDVSVEPFDSEFVVCVNREESSTHKMFETKARAMAYARACARNNAGRLIVFAADTFVDQDWSKVFGAIVRI